MSRSRRKTPIVAVTTAETDKPFKMAEHRAERRTYRALLTARLDPDDRRLHARQYGNENHSDKDGKQYSRCTVARDMRK
ncbi:MAG TPA: hypothetical protein VFX20_17740 [Steroidobacteraceae bacterium]|nr:hypothetical protein [Steroidobacteraceae bacterium]